MKLTHHNPEPESVWIKVFVTLCVFVMAVLFVTAVLIAAVGY